MPNCTPVLFKKSLVAVAILSLSACSTTPRVQDYDLSRIGEGILNAGRTTADVSERAWDKTAYLLGFSDVEPNDGTRNSDGDLLMDDVDIALLQEDAILPGQQATSRPVVIQSAKALPQDADLLTEDQSTLQAGVSETVIEDSAAEDAIDVEDLIHEVIRTETLWDIAKLTTGDANNWHVLADVNNLAPNAGVFPGQQLIIPADMVKPGFDDSKVAPKTERAAVFIDTQNLNGTANTVASAENGVSKEKLVIPTESSVSEDVAQVSTPEGRAFKLSPGETLWDFAKRTTGDATNWQAIAGQNNFTEKQAVLVRAGQTIYVPDTLVRPELDVAANAIDTPAKSTLDETVNVVAAETSATDADAISASTELLADASSLDETQSIKIVEATFKADDSIAPIAVTESLLTAPVVADKASNPDQIMVSGTYYPKAVYNDADFSSSLLMRVSPGTTLQVSKAMGNWFEVKTDKGVGYVHQRDIK